MKAPKLDKRTRQDLLKRAVEDLAPFYTPQWTGVSEPNDPGRRLIELFARLTELLIERLNRMPEKNFLSFLELTGVERFPGAPAEAPVTFVVSKRAPRGGLVPAGTQVATTQTEKADARVFETRRPFFATPAGLERIVGLLPATDQFVELPVPSIPPDAAALAAATPISVFTDVEPALRDVEHVLYLGSEALFSRKDAADISVTLQLSAGSFPAPENVVWRRYDKAVDGWVDLDDPDVNSLIVAGVTEVTFTFHGLEGVEKVAVDGVDDFWLAAHFTGPFDSSFTAPEISGAEGKVEPPAESLTQFDAAFYNSDPIDQSRPYHPFGRRPAYGDAFYFASDVAFGPDVESVTLKFTIRPYTTTDIKAQFDGVPSTTLETRALWQFLDEDGTWQDLGEYVHRFVVNTVGSTTIVTLGTASAPSTPPDEHGSEGTFIRGDPEATVASVTRSGFQDLIGHRPVHGVPGHWLRVLLKSEEPYGNDGVLVGGATPRFIGPLFFPPVVEEVEISYVPRTDRVSIANVKTLNGFEFRDHSGNPEPFQPFRSVASRSIDGFAAFGPDDALYLAFDRAFGPGFISLFFDLAGPASSLSSPLEGGNPSIAWEYWSAGSGWSSLDVADETLDLTTSGTVGCVGPEDAASLNLFPRLHAGAEADPVARWWFRARLASGSFDHPPAIRGIYLNTVGADNRSTVAELLVGSSNGEPNQVFALVKGPVLGGELWVREAELPGEEEIRDLETEHRGDRLADPDLPAMGPVMDVRSVEGGEREVWVRWRRTPNFLASGPRSRHYALDSVAAIVEFGDGDRGLIPSVGRNNLVFRGFQSGGGEAANRDALPLAIKELKTSLPFIDKVFNVQAASAGASAWAFDQLLEFGPQILKNRSRPVTIEDHEWMVRQRFSHVARVRCLPTQAPAPGGGLTFKAGAVTVLVVPKSTERRPQPSPGLVRKIREFLAATALANIATDIHVKGPSYEAVDIRATLAPTRPELASVVVRKATAALEAFLHPLTGGEDGAGYGFGRAVYLSEVHAVLERIEEVDHVVSAHFPGAPGEDEFRVDSDLLASSGTHVISV